MNANEMKVGSTIKSVDKALKVLETISTIEGGINLTALSEKLDMSKSGVYRMLQAFKERGYLEQRHKNGEYFLGKTAYMIGQNILTNTSVLKLARPAMEDLGRECNETVYLALRCDNDVVLIDSVESRHPVVAMPLTGRSWSLTDCAAGELLLAFDRPREELTVTYNVPAHRLEMLKRQGYCFDVGSFGDSLASLAVPLFDSGQRAAACLCLVGPEYRFSNTVIREKLLTALRVAGQALSVQLGQNEF